MHFVGLFLSLLLKMHGPKNKIQCYMFMVLTRFLRFVVQISLICVCLQEVILSQLWFIQYLQFYSLPTVYLQKNSNKNILAVFDVIRNTPECVDVTVTVCTAGM